MTITCQGLPGDGVEPVKSQITCVVCDGTSQVSKRTLERIEFEKNMWCKCDHETGTKYYDDGQHPEIHKHHWRCTSCKQVKQIG